MNKRLSITYLGCIGLHSFVALPVDKDGMVIRLSLEHAEYADAIKMYHCHNLEHESRE